MSHAMNHRVVILGGGAGGLELASKLGRRFGPRHVTLVDQSSVHIWKPSLHEVAAGTLDIHREGLSYFMLGRDCGFTFLHGQVRRIDRQARALHLEPVVSDTGEEIFPAREVAYDSLVLAVGSRSNFFGTPGASEFAIALDSPEEAERFRLKLLHELVHLNQDKQQGSARTLHVGIVGGGATGVELAAELLEACAHLATYGMDALDASRDVRITLFEGAPRILSALPEKMSAAAERLLRGRGVEVMTNMRVASLTRELITDANGNTYPFDLCVWAAGIEAPPFLAGLGLPCNRINQIAVDAGLRTEDPDVYALGDCAQAPWAGTDGFLPARAQVAHQQASFLLPLLADRIQGRTPPARRFVFRDYGSLVSVGHSRGVGSLMGVLSGKSWFVEGLLARIMYMSLHLMHHKAVLGVMRTATLALGRLLLKRSTPRVKLH